MSRTLITIFVCIFIGVGVFSFSKLISLSKVNELLTQDINNNYKPKIEKLEKENTKINENLAEAQNSLAVLEEENRLIKRNLRSKDNSLKQLQIALKRKDQALAEADSKHAEIESENNLLKEKISAMFLEFSQLRKAFSSVEALQERIKTLRSGGSVKKKKEIKRNKKKNEIIKKNQYIEKNPEPEVNTDAESDFNYGYLIKNGQSTYATKLRIRVTPVEE